jgi:hypothetical protein
VKPSIATVSPCLTLLAGVLGGIQANAYIVDAIIGLSVVYKAFENMGGFEKTIGFSPEHARRGDDLRPVPRLRPGHQAAGAGSLPQNGLVANIVSFNVGVEIGQMPGADGASS